MYKEPAWLKPFKRNRLDLESLTDKEIEKLRQETTQIIEENQHTKVVLANKKQQFYELACEIYGKDSRVADYLRKQPIDLPADYRKEWRKFVAAIEDARANKVRREKDRERRKQRAIEKAEQEREESNQVGPQNLTF
jgi:hypothetical protein